MLEVKQFGIQRSGTNYTRLVMARNFKCRVLINQQGWKHGPATDKLSADIPIVVTSKHPLHWLASFYEYLHVDGKVSVPFSQWVRGTSEPARYNLLYNHWLDLPHKKAFVRWEDLYNDPITELKSIEEALGLERLEKPIPAPKRTLRRNGHEMPKPFVPRDWNKQYDPDDIEFLREQFDKKLLKRMGYTI